MDQQEFEEYTYFVFGRKNGTANSYIMAVRILDRIFAIKDVFGLHGKTLTELNDEYILQRIADFVSSKKRNSNTEIPAFSNTEPKIRQVIR